MDECSHAIDSLLEFKFPIMHGIASRAKFYDETFKDTA